MDDPISLLVLVCTKVVSVSSSSISLSFVITNVFIYILTLILFPNFLRVQNFEIFYPNLDQDF